jgi:hypothetical protein
MKHYIEQHGSMELQGYDVVYEEMMRVILINNSQFPLFCCQSTIHAGIKLVVF